MFYNMNIYMYNITMAVNYSMLPWLSIILHYITLKYSTLHYTTVHYITLQYVALHYSTLQVNYITYMHRTWCTKSYVTRGAQVLCHHAFTSGPCRTKKNQT